MTVHKRDLRKNKLPAEFSQEDLDDLMAKPGALRKLLQGPHGTDNRRIIDELLSQRPGRPAISASKFTNQI